jgi:hypothetical protein
MKQFLAGLRRELGTAPERKRPLLTEDLREILLDLPDNKWGKRDRALLLLGFGGAFRSKLVALDVRFGRSLWTSPTTKRPATDSS